MVTVKVLSLTRARSTGHKRVIEDCLKIFDEVVVAVMVNTDKKPVFSEEERVLLLQKLFKDESRVKVVVYEGAVVDLLERENTPFYVRGRLWCGVCLYIFWERVLFCP